MRNVDGKPDLAGAKAQQERLRESVEVEDRLGVVRLVAGADIAYGRRDDTLVAAGRLRCAHPRDRRDGDVPRPRRVPLRSRLPFLPGIPIAVLQAIIALLAALLPAYRATQVDPMAALRAE